MLKTVVEEKNVDMLLLFNAMAFGKTILADTKLNPVSQALLHQLDFVACAASAAIAPAQNGDALPFRKKFFCEPQNHRCLTRAAHSQIANADHFGAQVLLLEPAIRIEPGAHSNIAAVQNRKRPEQDSRQQRKFHPFSRAAPSRCRAISAMARSVAPRLLPTRLRAVSPMRAARSGSRRNSIHATPASSGLSTWTAASAATNRCAISAKFSIDGPNTGTLPNAAGSRMLCPPLSTREPPTKAPSAT